jgi:glycosyltransferase involved in cell wall biosynthesis
MMQHTEHVPTSSPLALRQRKLRVLIVHDAISENGGVRLTLELGDRLRRGGATVTVYALQPVRGGQRARVPAGLPFVQGVPDHGRLRRHGAKAVGTLLRLCRGCDVVVSGSEIGLGLLLGLVAARLTRTPFVTIVHAPLADVIERWAPPVFGAATRQAHRRADAAICVSAPIAAGIIANGLPPDRVHVISNGIDVERVRRLAGAGPANGATPVLVGVGRLAFEKGFDLLIRAHAAVREAGLEHRLELVGDGPERVPLARLAAELGVADSVAFAGFVDNPLPRLVRADAFVLPSRYEGFPLSLLEALALGVPVIASRGAGHVVQALGDGVARFVEPDSVAELALAIRDHLERPEQLRSCAPAGRAFAERHEIGATAEAYRRVLEEIATR